ncbi:MAG: trehalose-6-phosphate synthase [candidate division Zixibacteria bacterium]|nr:trehalose-6-phosphate synthase [candidate division Zixibacteria bacterium]
MKHGNRRLLVVSNRLPVSISGEEGEKQVKPGAGGLVTAMNPIMKSSEGVWIGWPGCELSDEVKQLLSDYNLDGDFQVEGVKVTPEEERRYYRGFSNEALWPLFHDLLGHCNFEFDDWKVYSKINRRFAKKIVEVTQSGDFIWVHDYQLIMVAHYLRQMNIHQPLAFFLHTPFPSPDLIRRLPWKNEIIRGLLEYDLIGFQTYRDRRNFLRGAKELMPELQIRSRARYSDIRFGMRTIKVGHFPISIDFREFNQHARTRDVAVEARKLDDMCHAESLMLGVDRLDYTKGIPDRLLAIERALEKYPELIGKISLLQLVVPSRSKLSSYRNLKADLDSMVGRINGRFSKFGWQPIQYMYRAVSRTELLGFYRACDIALITPLRDGMNLVCKEYCASSTDRNGVLILSEFAGAADQMGKGAILVNPYNREETADAICDAFYMDSRERRRRMKTLRAEVKRNDIFRWVDWFLTAFKSWQDESPMASARPYDTLPRNVRISAQELYPLNRKGD